MKVSRQIAVVAIGGALAVAAWSQWAFVAPVLGNVPGLAFLAPKAAPGSAGGGAGRGGSGGAPMLVEVAALGTGAVIETSEAVGNTRANESVAITSRVSGVVEKVLFIEGQNVKAGDELIRLDAAEKQADLEAAKAAILTTRAQRDEMAQKLGRAQSLRQTGAGTEAQVADLTLQLKTIETNIAAAEARERAAAARLDDLIIRAPFDGRVGLRQISVGALLDSKVVVTTLDDVSRMRLDFSVPETLITKIAVGAPVRAFSLAFPGRVFEGQVAVIDTRIDLLTRSAKVTALIPNPDAALKPGMFMNVSLQVAARENALLAWEEAIVAEGPRQIAFVVKDGKIERRVVQIGQRQAGKVEVTQGLSAGDILVVRGIQRIRQGMPVQTKPAFPEKQGAPSAETDPTKPGKKA
ncbi:MAG: efflux RND transporter periplasmic adaptor subunit [Proteobacteria bacterium]|nr:efflux RND transporter periplasmic adaptor subunit [Pseudomonadota bacterium]